MFCLLYETVPVKVGLLEDTKYKELYEAIENVFETKEEAEKELIRFEKPLTSYLGNKYFVISKNQEKGKEVFKKDEFKIYMYRYEFVLRDAITLESYFPYRNIFDAINAIEKKIHYVGEYYRIKPIIKDNTISYEIEHILSDGFNRETILSDMISGNFYLSEEKAEISALQYLTMARRYDLNVRRRIIEKENM